MSQRVIPPLVKGALGQFGYSAYASERERHKALEKAIKQFGALSVFRKLNAVYVLNKNRDPRLANIFLKDREWVYKKYYGTPQWTSKVTISTPTRKKLAKRGLLRADVIKKLASRIRGKRIRLDPDIKVRKTLSKARELIGEVLKVRDWKAKGLIRVVKGEKKEFPEFAIYLSKRKAKPHVHDWDSFLKNAGFTKEQKDKYVLRTNKFNLFVYLV